MRKGIIILFLCISAFVFSNKTQAQYPSYLFGIKDCTDSSILFSSDPAKLRHSYPHAVAMGIQSGPCKSFIIVYVDTNSHAKATAISLKRKLYIDEAKQPEKSPFLKIHGNVYYDVYYQSQVDTPYIERDIYQHTITTYLDVSLKDKYPMRVSFTTRFNNSSLFRNYTGLNLQYNSQMFKNEILERARAWANAQLARTNKLTEIRSLIDERANKLAALKSWLTSPSLLQKAIEAKERALINARNQFNNKVPLDTLSVKTPTIDTSLDKPLQTQISNIETQYRNEKEMTAGAIRDLAEELKRIQNDKNLLSKVLPSGKDTLKLSGDKTDSSIAASQQVDEAKPLQFDSLQNELSKLESRYVKAKDLKLSNTDSLAMKIEQMKNTSLLSKLSSLQMQDFKFLKDSSNQADTGSNSAIKKIETRVASLQKEYEEKKRKYDSLQNELSKAKALYDRAKEIKSLNFKDPASALQKLQENKDLLSKLSFLHSRKTSSSKDTINSKDSAGNSMLNKIDTTAASWQKEYDEKKKEYDSLQNEVSKLESKYINEKEVYGQNVKNLAADLMQVKDSKDLLSKISSLRIPDSVLPKGYKTLLAVKSFGIGRSIVNYSELTAKNISITGIQVEYNPSYYYAFASGAVDYQFRDFIVNDPNRQKQYLNLVRFGRGIKDATNIVFTCYFGKKQLYNYGNFYLNNQNTPAPDYHIMGFSIEGKYSLDKNNTIVIEAAKSSLPYFNRLQNKQSVFASTFSFKDRTNEAYSVKFISFFPITNTRINAFYKHMGAGFQSFSLYTTGSTQTAWSVRADQPFFKNRLTVSASVRTNDYTSPYLASYKSNTVFKSIQATMRVRKLPIISVGYFPSSQLTKLGDEQYVENLFYTLVGTMSYFYNWRGAMMNTYVTYTRFYNKQSDSGFVYFNTRNLTLNQSVILNRFTFQVALSAATNNTYSLYSAGTNIQYKLSRWLSLGGGVKYNKQTVFENEQIGHTLSSTIKIPKLGELQVRWEKGFIPGINQQLVQNNIGRITYFKIF